VSSASVDVDAFLLRHNLSAVAVGIGVGLLVGWAIAPELVGLYRRHLERLEAKGTPTLSLPQMDLFDIADHLLKRSSWGRWTLAKVNFEQMVVAFVPDEISRAAAAGVVRMLGRGPNSATTKEIDKAYWRFARVDDLRLWDRRNTSQTVLRSASASVPDLQAYFDLTAPAVDVLTAWPKASPFLRVGVPIWLVMKNCFFRIKGRLLQLRHRIRL
jgi:hypothetical protein